MHKEKTPSHTNVGTSLSDGLAQYGGVKSAYKIKDLIHFSQENDLKILGLEKGQALFMSDGIMGTEILIPFCLICNPIAPT